MPRSFDTREEGVIRTTLRETARNLFRRKGLTGTTIDQLIRSARIAKGSFYKFYPSKEWLYFDLLEDAHEALRHPLLRVETSDRRDREWFALQFRTLLQRSMEEPLILNLAETSTMQALVRRLPPERLRAHERKDQQFLDALIEKWSPPQNRPDRDQLAARMTMAAMVSLQPQLFGERLHSLALDAAIASLVDCIIARAD